MHDSIDWTLVGKIVAGEATDAERQQFDDWVSAHPEQRRLLDTIRQFWLTSAMALPTGQLDVAGAFERLQQRIDSEQRGSEPPARSLWPARRWVGWAAAASVSIAIGVWVWTQSKVQPSPKLVSVVEQINQKGTRSQIRLADGSLVWLNADSHLHYPKAFTGNLREVTLEGEAFFKVTHNPKQPFVVRLATGLVRVLGTSFNIRAYPGDSTVETSVVTGRVAFVPKPAPNTQQVTTDNQGVTSANDTLFLTPNLKAIQSLTRQSVTTQPTVAANQIAWTESKLVFRNTPMGEVAKTLERWYGTPIMLERESLRQCPLTGTFQNQSLREVMTLIAMTNRFQVDLTPSQVTIKGPGCSGQ